MILRPFVIFLGNFGRCVLVLFCVVNVDPRRESRDLFQLVFCRYRRAGQVIIMHFNDLVVLRRLRRRVRHLRRRVLHVLALFFRLLRAARGLIHFNRVFVRTLVDLRRILFHVFTACLSGRLHRRNSHRLVLQVNVVRLMDRQRHLFGSIIRSSRLRFVRFRLRRFLF